MSIVYRVHPHYSDMDMENLDGFHRHFVFPAAGKGNDKLAAYYKFLWVELSCRTCDATMAAGGLMEPMELMELMVHGCRQLSVHKCACEAKVSHIYIRQGTI